MKSLSVVIPLYNKEQNLRATIQSVLSQSYRDFTLIVINDGSTDNSLAVLNEFKDSGVIILSQENKGVSSARNRGIKEAATDYIALLDADDIWDHGYLSEMISFINDYPLASLYGCGYSFQESHSGVVETNLGLQANYKGYIDYFVHAKDNTLFTSSSVIFRRDAFLALGGFDESLTRGEDIDLWIRFALHKKTAFYNKPLVIYKLDGENRALRARVPSDKSLLWNLERYKQYELTDPVFKQFLDNWRLAHLHNYLTGVSTEVTEIKPLLRDIDLKKYSKLWRALLYSPKPIQPIIYRIWISLRSKFKRN